jgi:transcriptional regulator with XRE-family HTH domain
MKEENIANLLATLRKEKNLTQSELAAMLDVTFQAVSKWERGENLPDAYTLTELAKIYDITVDEILNGKLNPKEDSKRKSKLIIFIVATAILVASPASIFIFGYDNWNIYVPIIIGLAGISIGLIIYASKGNDGISNYTGEKSKQQLRKEEIIYSIAAGIFLILGLAFNLFHIAWIIFIFAYALTKIVNNDSK